MVKRRWLNRDLVVAKAVELADSARKLEAVSLKTLAEALDIRTPSLYNHITSLEDLHNGMALFALRQLLADLREAAVGQVGQAAIVSIANAYRHFAHTHPGVYLFTLHAPEPDATELANLAQELVQMLSLVMASLGLAGDDAIHAIRGLRAILHGFVSLEAAAGYKMPLEPDESFRRLIAAYLDGLSKE
jgi:AcrR family transcriptional regulator